MHARMLIAGLLQRGREEKLTLADVCRQPVLGSGDPEHSRIVAHFFCVVVCNDDCRAAKAETEDDADEQTLLPPPVKGVERHETDGTHVMKNDARATRDVRDCEEIGLDVWTLFWIFLCCGVWPLQSVCVCACPVVENEFCLRNFLVAYSKTKKYKLQLNSNCFSGWKFRSSDLWVMGPTRFLCANPLCV